jgi:hypothetical protein
VSGNRSSVPDSLSLRVDGAVPQRIRWLQAAVLCADCVNSLRVMHDVLSLN